MCLLEAKGEKWPWLWQNLVNVMSSIISEFDSSHTSISRMVSPVVVKGFHLSNSQFTITESVTKLACLYKDLQDSCIVRVNIFHDRFEEHRCKLTWSRGQWCLEIWNCACKSNGYWVIISRELIFQTAKKENILVIRHLARNTSFCL